MQVNFAIWGTSAIGSKDISSDRKEVTCSAAGYCGQCEAGGGNNVLEAEGNLFFFMHSYFINIIPYDTELYIDTKPHFSGPSIIREKNDTTVHYCLDMCYTDANCTAVLYSAALSDCVLLSAPPVCTIDTILESYTMSLKTGEVGKHFRLIMVIWK